LDVVYGSKGLREDIIGEVLKAEKFVEKIKHIHLQVHETLKKSLEKYKAIHDQHKNDKSFKVRDVFWLQINKERLQGHVVLAQNLPNSFSYLLPKKINQPPPTKCFY